MAKKPMTLKERVVQVLKREKKQFINLRRLAVDARVTNKEKEEFKQLMETMRETGETFQKKTSVILGKNIGLVYGEIISILPRFGFARPTDIQGNPLSREKDNDIFIPGHMLMGAIPGDVVAINLVHSGRTDRKTGQIHGPEGAVIQIVIQSNKEFTGIVQNQNNKIVVIPDKNMKIPMEVEVGKLNGAKKGDKVSAQISVRGENHFIERVKIIKVFGSAQSAESCCEAVMETYNARLKFDEKTLAEARKISELGTPQGELMNRMDLTDHDIFTIDSADSKDLDDAVSLEKDGDNWFLGVHIADVSYYVKRDLEVDKEAFARGTSVYYADQVLPMLPKELSNGICSLNPDEVRLTFSALITLDSKGDIIGYKFVKSYIRSRVKGIYKEINAILDGSSDEEINQKYSQLIPQIKLMQELAHMLSKKRFARGALNIESTESKFIIENGKVLDILPRISGESEHMIEEFMLTANQAAATVAIENGLPFVYRIHDKPPATKLDILHKMSAQVGLDASKIGDKPQPKDLSDLLEQARGTPLEQMVNNQLLRTMAKAIYSSENIGHFGLVLQNYAHFTSPIRRYPDLIIHRILSSFVGGAGQDSIKKRFADYVSPAAKHCSDMELNAMNIERDCEDCYKAEYMHNYIGQTFEGIIVSITSFGMYVQLPNTVEGLVHVRSMPAGDYKMTESMEFVERNSNKRYKMGEKLEVVVLHVDVSAGLIDFALAENTNKNLQNQM